MYTGKRKTGEKKQMIMSQELNDLLNCSANSTISEADSISQDDLDNIEDDFSDRDDEASSSQENGSSASKGRELSVDYLENDLDIFQSVNDWDGIVICNFYYFSLLYFPLLYDLGLL